MTITTDYTPVIDRSIGELFLLNADDPIKTHIMGLVHDWWATAPQSAIDQYSANLRAMPGFDDFFAAQYLPPTITLEQLESCPEGSLGHAYKNWIVDQDLMPDLAKNYHRFHEKMRADGSLDRMPEDVTFMFVRGFMLHDYLHTITGWGPDPIGELGMAGFHHAQIESPYHAMRIATTTAHIAFVQPRFIGAAMDAISKGWRMGKNWKNLHFVKWEEQLDRPLADIRAEYGDGTVA